MDGKAAKIIDGFLIFVVSSLFFGATAGYFFRGAFNILFAALAGGLSLTALISMPRKKSKKPNAFIVKQAMLQFVFMGENSAFSFIKCAFSKKYEVKQKQRFFVVNSTAVFVRLSPKKILAADLGEMYAKANKFAKRILVLSLDGLDKEATIFLDNLPNVKINVFKAEKVFNLLHWLGSLPPITIPLKKQKNGLKKFVCAALSPANSRGYLFSAFALVCSSFITAYRIYYLIAAAVCLLSALACKLQIIKRLKRLKS